MKILHMCLASFYIDNYSYQENMLPKFHKKFGFDVEIIASLVSFDSNGKPCLLNNEGEYINEYGIPVTRLGYKKTIVNRILRRYKGVYNAIKNSNPDIIFIHGCQFMDIKYIKKYYIENPNVKIYVDNHADFSNSAKSFFSKNILHKVIWKHCAKLIEPVTKKFFGVLPARVDFLKDIYGICEDKVELLVMGADDEIIDKVNKSNTKQKIRVKHDIKDKDFLVITGGKIDKAKLQIIQLMEVAKSLADKNVKLIVFGSVLEELKDKVGELVDGVTIQFVGWVSVEESYEYLAAADLAIFPGRHSVYWEQAAGMGIPMVVKYWEGTTHVNVGGNCKFLYKDNIDEIRNALLDILENPSKYSDMMDAAQNKAKNEFLYSKISLKSIGCF